MLSIRNLLFQLVNYTLLVMLLLLTTSFFSTCLAWQKLEQLTMPEQRHLLEEEKDTYTQALKALTSNQSTKARQLLTPLAQQGIIDAQLALGTLLNQSSMQADKKEALKWLYFAAHGEVWLAQIEVAKSYRLGQLITRNYSRARSWLNRAITKAGTVALEELNQLNQDMLKEANRAIQNKQYKIAEKRLLPVAKAGVAQAQHQLASLYQNKHLGEHQKTNAIDWYKKAAQQGWQAAQLALAKLYLNNPQTINEKKLTIIQLLEEAAKPGSPEAQFQLGMMYLHGQGVNKNSQRALYWYRLAAEQEHVEAQYSLGVRYSLGLDMEKDPAEAHRWFKRAAKQNHAKAQHNLALTYLHGIGTQKQTDKAQWWFSKASQAGVEKAAAFVTPQHHKKIKTKRAIVTTTKTKKNSTQKNDKQIEVVLGQRWFKQLPNRGYTLQVISGSRSDGIEDFLVENNLKQGDYFHYIIHSNEIKRHVIQYGYYNNLIQAKHAANELSQGFTQFKPWIRKIKTIKKIIKNTGQKEHT